MKERKEIPPEIIFKRYSRENLPPPEKIHKSAELFAEVFADGPWFEVSQCRGCEKFYGPNEDRENPCAHCGSVLREAYPEAETCAMIENVFLKENAALYLLEQGDEVLGFGWGFMKKNLEYLPLFENGGTEVLKDINRRGSHESFALSEIGIRKSARGKGYGKELVKLLIMEAQELDVPITVWTRYDTILTPICLNNGFDQIYGYNVILANRKSYGGVNSINGVDFRYPERVFFVKP